MGNVGFHLMALNGERSIFNSLPAERKHSGRCLHGCPRNSNTFSQCECVSVFLKSTQLQAYKNCFYESLCLLWFYSSCYYQHLILLFTYTVTSPLLDPHHGRYNPDTDSWSTDVAPLSSPRSGVCLVAMDGYLYAIGGHDGIAAINTVERYCSMSGTKDQYLTKLTVNPLNAYCGCVQDISSTLSSTTLYYFPHKILRSKCLSLVFIKKIHIFKALFHFSFSPTTI